MLHFDFRLMIIPAIFAYAGRRQAALMRILGKFSISEAIELSMHAMGIIIYFSGSLCRWADADSHYFGDR